MPKRPVQQPQAMTKQAKYTNSDIIQSFTAFRTLMDTKNDKFERIVKMSRDVTITSKRIIFNLHRISPDLDNKVAVLAESKEKLHNLIPIFERIGSELEGEDVYLYFRAYTNGVQEFIEAISFYHVIVSEAVIRPDQLSEYFGPSMCPLINSDYFGGIADLTGEMMRMCISFIGRGDVETGNRLRELLYQVNVGLTYLNPSDKMMVKKLEVMIQSLKKCETASYTASVRRAEFPHQIINVSVEQE